MTDSLSIPVLTTDRLRLEPVSMLHSQEMFELWSDPAVCEYSGVVRDYDRNVIPMPAASPADSDRIIDFWLRAAGDGWGFRWAVLIPGEGSAFAGTVGFNSVTVCAEIAYHLLPAYWGQGIMMEACDVALAWSRRNGISECEAFIEPENSGSIALAERLGMTATGEVSEGCLRFLRPG